MFLVSWIIKSLIARQVSERAAKVMPWVILGVAAIILLSLGWYLLKAGILSDYKTEQRAEQAERAIENRIEADTVDNALERRDDARAERLEEVIDEAAATEPEAAARPVGPVSNAAIDELRNRPPRNPGNRTPDAAAAR